MAGRSIANPLGEKVKIGSADFLRQGGELSILQKSKTLIVDWKDFSIREGELTRFVQPGSSAAALNRVYGGNPSEIYGSLKANGSVYLINPNGVFIGPSGRVDAGSFTASTLDASDDRFLKGGDLQFSGDSKATVVNMGKINALDGNVFLIATSVENHGEIRAAKGTAGLVGGTDVVLKPDGGEMAGVSVASGSGRTINSGKIAAAQAELKAAGGNLYALAIQNSGVIRATGVTRKGGRILLRANQGTLENSGRLEARKAKGTGGVVAMTASSRVPGMPGKPGPVRVVNSGKISASGKKGGTVSVEGDELIFKSGSRIEATGTEFSGGVVAITSADRVTVENGATMDVRGLEGGRIELTGADVTVGEATFVADGVNLGGMVSAIASGQMAFDGTISATSLAPGSPGGTAEVSGFGSLDYVGAADLRGGSGVAGSLLLDPSDFTINAATAAVITSNLQTSNVVVATNASAPGNGDIFVLAPLLYSSANSLTLLAHRNISAEASIQNNGAGAISLVAGWDGSTGLLGGTFQSFKSTPTSFGNNGGQITIGNGSQGAGIAIGSRFGQTNVAASELVMTGSGSANRGFVQLGFASEALSNGSAITGPIDVVLRNDLLATGGNSNFSYVQIGHGGSDGIGSFSGDISIAAGGNVQMLGGVNFSYVQIGHGGDGSQGTMSGGISVSAASLNITGGNRPNAYAMIGHGDGADTSSGSRSGGVQVSVAGPSILVNGPASNAAWTIGHRSTSAGAISNSPVAFAFATLGYGGGGAPSQFAIDQDFANKFAINLRGGDVTLSATGSQPLVVSGAFDYASAHNLTFLANVSAELRSSVSNSGSGEILVVVDAANQIRPTYNAAATLTIGPTAALSSGGAVRLFATQPASTTLGGFTPVQRRYGTWFGDAVTVAGVNYKFQPTLVLSANSTSKTYGQFADLSTTGFSISGLQPGDSLGGVLSGSPLLISPGTAASAGVANSPYPITFADGLSTNFGYGLQLVPGTLTVTAAPLTITAQNAAKIYGTSVAFTGKEFVASGLVNNDAVSSVALTSLGAVGTAGVAGSPYSIVPSSATGSGLGNYSISYVPGSLTVSPAALTITPQNRSKVYGTTLSFSGTEFSASGLLNGDSVSNVQLASAGGAATAGVAGSPYAITASNALGVGLGNYTIAYGTGTLTVTPAALTITAQNLSKVYGSTLSFTGGEFTTSGLVNNDSVSGVSLASLGSAATAPVAGALYSIAPSNAVGVGLSNYTISYLPGGLSITPAALTITARNQSKVYGTSFTFGGTEFTAQGLLNSDRVTSVALSSLGQNPAAGVTGSPYAISASNAAGNGLGNYTIAYASGALAVTPAALTITGQNLSKVYGTSFAFTGKEFSASGLVNSDTVTSVSLVSAGAAATAGVAGSPYAITLSNAVGSGLANYTISYVQGGLAVTPAALTITAQNRTKVYGNALVFAGSEFSATGLLNSDSVSAVTLTSPGTLATAGVSGSPYAIVPSNAVGVGLGNYFISYLPGGLTVTPAALTITARNQSKVYGSTFAFTGIEFTAQGLLNTDQIAGVSLASPAQAGTAGVVGSPYPISVSNAVGTGLGNYIISYVPGAFSVTPAALTITAQNLSKVYGTTLGFTGKEFSASGLLNSDSVSNVGLASAGSVATAGVASSPYAIDPSNAVGTGLSNYVISYLPGNLAITPAPLTITARNQSKIYGGTFLFTGSEFNVSGLLNNDAVSNVALTSAGAVPTAGVAGSPYAITASNAVGTGLGNYTITYAPGALTVTPAALTVTAANGSKVYGNTITFAGTEFTTSGLLNGDVVTRVSLASTGAGPTAGVAGAPYSILPSNALGTGLANYTITYAPGALNVTPAPLTISAQNQSKVYASTFAFGGTEFIATGLRNGEMIGRVELSSAGALASAAVERSPYTIAIGGAKGGSFTASNYDIAYVPGAFTVTPYGLIITALDQSKVYGTLLSFGGKEFKVAGLREGDAVNSVSLSSPGAGTLAGVAGGPYAIVPSNAMGVGLSNYTISYVPGALTVTPAALTITARDVSKVYGTTLQYAGTEFTASGLLNADTVTSVTLSSPGTIATAGVLGSPYRIDISGAAGSGLGNYTITYAPGALNVTPAALTVTARDLSKVYGSTLQFSGSEFSAAGLLNGDTITGVSLGSTGAVATAGVAASPYAIVPSNALGNGLSNYVISYVPGALNVTPAALTIAARDLSKVYGTTIQFAGSEFSASGLLNDDSVSSVTLASPGTAAIAGVAASPYAITPSDAVGTGLGNYSITYIPGALAVTPAALTVTAQSVSKVYGATLSFSGTEFTTAGLLNGDSISGISLTSAGASAMAGVAGSPYTILPSDAVGIGLANYTISYAPGGLTVTPAALTVTANDFSKIYGAPLNFAGTEFAVSGLLNSDSITNVSLSSAGAASTAGVADGPYPVLAANALGQGLENYNITYIPGVLTVDPAALTISALDKTKVYGRSLVFEGTEFTAAGLHNGETIGRVDIFSEGANPRAGVAAGPYAISVSNPTGGSFDPRNYVLSFESGTLNVTPAKLTITARDQQKLFGRKFTFNGTEFIVSGLQNGETIGAVTLTSPGAATGAGQGLYKISISGATGGSYDPANYAVSFNEGTLRVLAPVVPPPQPEPPPDPLVIPGLQDLLAMLGQNNTLASRPSTDPVPTGEAQAIISSFGIQRPNLSSFFGEQLLLPGGAMMIDETGVGPPVPIGEAPADLEGELAEQPHEMLEEAIAEDDKRRKLQPSTRFYELRPGEVFSADRPGEVKFDSLKLAPDALKRAIDEGVETLLQRAAVSL